MRKFFIIVSCIAILLSVGHISCLATDTNETNELETSESEDVKYPWFIQWQSIVDHEFFADEAPGRPFNVSPRLWYVIHHKPADTYPVDIAFVGYKPMTKEVMRPIAAEYAVMKGYDDFDAWLDMNRDNKDEMAAYYEYESEQQKKWLDETNGPLIEQYLRPEDQYVYNELVTDPTLHVTCNMSLERILELAATEDCQKVWIDFDRDQLVAGYDLYGIVFEPWSPSLGVTEQPTAEETTVQTPDTDPLKTEEQKEDPKNENNSCTGLIALPALSVVPALLGILIRKKKE